VAVERERGIRAGEDFAVAEVNAVEKPYSKAAPSGITHDEKSFISVSSSFSNCTA
jgi:hypothetical protein